MTDEEFKDFATWYYRVGSADRAAEALDYYVTSGSPIKDAHPPQLNPSLYLFARIAELTPGLIRKYELVFDNDMLTRKGRTFLIWLLELAGDGQTSIFLDSKLNESWMSMWREAKETLDAESAFKTNPYNRHIRDGLDLDLMWCEFILTGNQKAVLRIVSVLARPDRIRERLEEWLRFRGVPALAFWTRRKKNRTSHRLLATAQISCDADKQQVVTPVDRGAWDRRRPPKGCPHWRGTIAPRGPSCCGRPSEPVGGEA